MNREVLTLKNIFLDLGREVIIKLRFGSRSKKLKNKLRQPMVYYNNVI